MSQRSSFAETIARNSRQVSGGLWTASNVGLAVVEGISHDPIAAGGAFGMMAGSIANLAFGEHAQPFSGPVTLAATAAIVVTGIAHRDVPTIAFGLASATGALALYYEDSPLPRLLNRLTGSTSGKTAAMAFSAANGPLLYEAGKLAVEGLTHHDGAKMVAAATVATISAGFIAGNTIAGMKPSPTAADEIAPRQSRPGSGNSLFPG